MPTSATGEQNRTAVLLGASGVTGQKLLPLLLDHSGYSKVITLSRRESGISHWKLEHRLVDFAHLAAGLRSSKVDDCYCTFGTTIKIAGSQEAMTRIDHDFVLDFAQASLAVGATRFAYLSAANANSGSTVFYGRLKGQTEDALKKLGFADLGIFRPGMIIAKRTHRRWAESLLIPVLPLLDKLMIGSVSKYRSIPVETLAKALAAFAGERGTGTTTRYWSDMIGTR